MSAYVELQVVVLRLLQYDGMHTS